MSRYDVGAMHRMIVNGWTLCTHPLFEAQLEKLARAVEAERAKKPDSAAKSANAKLLAAITKLILETIPDDPTRPEYRQGGTLGPSRKHWFRAKFASGRFRLFFRFSSSAKVIIYAWVNDSETLRTYGSKTDAYAVFKTMLDAGNPPDDWADLIKNAATIDPEETR
jgi:toxin YhaV